MWINKWQKKARGGWQGAVGYPLPYIYVGANDFLIYILYRLL